MTGSNRITFYRNLSIAALCALHGPTNIAHSAENSIPRQVVVKKGESLYTIVRREFGRTDPRLWRQVAEYNNRSVDQTLEIGDVLLLPEVLMKPQVILQRVNVTDAESASEEAADPVQPDAIAGIPTETQVELTVQQVIRLETDVAPALTGATEPDQAKQPEAECDAQDNCVEEPSATPQSVGNTMIQSNNDATADNTPTSGLTTTDPRRENVDQSGVTAEKTHTPRKPTAPPAIEQTAIEQPAVEPPAKPGLFEVDEESAVRALERSLIQLNALLLSPGRVEATLSYDYSLNTGAEPVLVSIEDSATDTTTEQPGQLESEVANNTVTLDLKFGLPFDSQINLSWPITSINQQVTVIAPGAEASDQDSTSKGRGDFSVTFDKTLAIESGRRPDIILSATYNSDSGSNEISNNTEELTVGVRATKRQDPLVFTAGLSQTITKKADDEINAGDVRQLSIGTLLAASPYTSLQFLFSQAIVERSELNGQSIPGTNANIASFSAGVSSVISKDWFLNGQLSIGLVDKAADYRLSIDLARQFSL